MIKVKRFMKRGKLFLKIFKYLPGAHWKMQLQQYGKISSKVPALADELWANELAFRRFLF